MADTGNQDHEQQLIDAALSHWRGKLTLARSLTALTAELAKTEVWNVLAEERGAQEQRKCSCKVT